VTVELPSWVVQVGTSFVLVAARNATEALAEVQSGGLFPASARRATQEDRDRFARENVERRAPKYAPLAIDVPLPL
jgi:hypothetical protein